VGLKPTTPADMNSKDTSDKMLRRLMQEVRVLKEKLNSPDQQTPRIPDGDYAMLSSKPLMGYRCMALDKLDDKSGPYIPSKYFPTGNSPPRQRSPQEVQAAGPFSRVAPEVKNKDVDKRGPQHWYVHAFKYVAEMQIMRKMVTEITMTVSKLSVCPSFGAMAASGNKAKLAMFALDG
jgi:hypothetical protein